MFQKFYKIMVLLYVNFEKHLLMKKSDIINPVIKIKKQTIENVD